MSEEGLTYIVADNTTNDAIVLKKRCKKYGDVYVPYAQTETVTDARYIALALNRFEEELNRFEEEEDKDE